MQLFLNNCVEEEKWNGLYSTKLVKKNVSPEAKMYSFSCPFILSIIAWTGGYHGDTEGSFLIGCQDEVRVTRKVETRRCRGWYFFLLFLLSPLSLLSASVLPHLGSFPLHSGFCLLATAAASLILMYCHPKYMLLWYTVCKWKFYI